MRNAWLLLVVCASAACATERPASRPNDPEQPEPISSGHPREDPHKDFIPAHAPEMDRRPGESNGTSTLREGVAVLRATVGSEVHATATIDPDGAAMRMTIDLLARPGSYTVAIAGAPGSCIGLATESARTVANIEVDSTGRARRQLELPASIAFDFDRLAQRAVLIFEHGAVQPAACGTIEVAERRQES